MKGKFLINNLKEKDKKEGVTLICTFSRKILVPFFFRSLDEMDLPRKEIHLLIYDNTEDYTLEKELKEIASGLISQFKSVRLYKSFLKGKGNIIGSGNEIFRDSKLQNIWLMWKRLYKMIYTSTFFQLEDDTIAPPHAFKRLYRTLLKDSKIGLVTGIATGRHAYPWLPVRLGVHYVKMRGMKVIERHSLNPNTKGIVPVDATGVYCFAARTKAFLTGFEGYDPISLNVPFFALDNVLTWNIKTHGYKIYADFSVWCSHLQCSAARIIAFGKKQALEMVDLWLPQYNNYAQGVEIKEKNKKRRRLRVNKPALSWEL